MRIHAKLGAALGALVLTFGIVGIGFAGSQSLNPASGRSLIDQGCDIVHPQDVVLIIDTSGSMGSNSSNGKTRLEWAKIAAKQLVDSLDAKGGVGGSGAHRVGLTRFSGSSASVVLALGGSSAGDVNAAINGLSSSGNTPLKQGMSTGAGDMATHGRLGDVQHVLILLSDGRPWSDQGPNGSWATNTLGQRPTSVQGGDYLDSADVRMSVALGATGGSGANLLDLALMALLGPDGAYHVVNGGELPDVFADIFEQITCPTEPPVTDPPVTDPPVTDPPVTAPPVTAPPVTAPPVTAPPVTAPPVTEPPVTEAPPSFEQSVGADTDAPSEPNTATFGGNGTSAPADGAWLLVVALGVLLASVVVLTPAPARRRK